MNSHTKYLNPYAWALFWATFILMIAGGLVTSTNTGDSVPDWPLAFGQLIPPITAEIQYEYFHRVIAGFVAVMTLVLMIWLMRLQVHRGIKILGIFAFLLVIFQAVLGGITVLLKLSQPVSIAHAILAQTFFVCVIALAVMTSSQWQGAPQVLADTRRKVMRLGLLTFGFTYAQLLTGALMRHGHNRVLLIHIVGSFVIMLHAWILWKLIRKYSRSEPLRLGLASLALALVTSFQILLGFCTFHWTFMANPGGEPSLSEIFIVTAHQTTGAAILVLIFRIILKACRWKTG